MTSLAFIPSPSQGVWHLGPVPLRAYALCIIAGIAVAIWLGQRRWEARGGDRELIADVAVWAVPFGIAGGRLYHVVSSPDAYFGAGGNPWKAFAVWEGGLGIWGAVALGGVGAWIACRRRGIPLPPLGDAIAPGIVLAQAVGRFGNWFNQELFGGPTTVPWALEIDAEHRPSGLEEFATFHPTFLYEALWNVAVAIVVVIADRRLKLGWGRVFALYVALYCIGRAFVENLRIDDAHEIGAYRLNVWVSLGLFVLAMIYFVAMGRRRPSREPSAVLDIGDATGAPAVRSEDSHEPDGDEVSVSSPRDTSP